MLRDGLFSLDVSDENKQNGMKILYEQLEAPDEDIRWLCVFMVSSLKQIESISRLLPLLKDSSEGVRIVVAEELSKIGDEGTAREMEVIQNERKRQLSKKEIHDDYSLQAADKAIELLKTKGKAEGTAHGEGQKLSQTILNEVHANKEVSGIADRIMAESVNSQREGERRRNGTAHIEWGVFWIGTTLIVFIVASVWGWRRK